jgi:hypothetical protein
MIWGQHFQVMRFNRYEDLEKILLQPDSLIARRCSLDEMKDCNEKVAELCLAKVAPRVGRACRQAEDLAGPLLKIADIFSNRQISPESVAKSFCTLGIALLPVTDVSAEKAQEILQALAEFDCGCIPESDILYPLTQLNTFKDLRKDCMKSAASRIKTLTKTMTLSNLTSQLEVVESGFESVSGISIKDDTTLAQALQAAATYVATLQEPHEDVKRFTLAADRLVELGSLFCRKMDPLGLRLLGGEGPNRTHRAQKSGRPKPS